MCNQVQSVTLQTAVLMQVKEFAQNNTPFSIHDITRAIRSKCASGELEIPEVETQNFSFRYDIQHSKVKVFFDDLWRNGVFDPEFSLNRKFVNGMYFEYTPTLNTPIPSTLGSGIVPSATPAPTDPVYLGTPITSIAPASPVIATILNGMVTRPVIIDRVKLYLANCRKQGFCPTLKQVQSAIKRNNRSTGWTCPELSDVIKNDLGYTVTATSNFASDSQVNV